MAVQTHASSTSQECSKHFPDLQRTPWSPLPTPGLRAVWLESLHSKTSPFSRHGVDCDDIGRSFPSDLKVAVCMSQHTFGGCAQYTPHMGVCGRSCV
jgi:hypothetical protein